VQADAVGRISSRRALRVDKTRYELFVLLHGISSLVRFFFYRPHQPGSHVGVSCTGSHKT
jgi:hypothetical protein